MPNRLLPRRRLVALAALASGLRGVPPVAPPTAAGGWLMDRPASLRPVPARERTRMAEPVRGSAPPEMSASTTAGLGVPLPSAAAAMALPATLLTSPVGPRGVITSSTVRCSMSSSVTVAYADSAAPAPEPPPPAMGSFKPGSEIA
jgi:hypothetical protein